MKATRALVLFLLTVLLCPALASAGTLGPALNYEELLDMVRRAKDGDILLVSGEMTATEEAISSPALLQISGDGRAVLHRLHISDSSVVLSDVELRDSLTISGISNVELRTVRVEGAPGQSGLSLVGGGTLLIDGDCEITGGKGATGVSVSQRGGALRAKLGAMGDTCRFYAPFASYEAVCQLFEDVFDDDGDILEALRSNRSFSKP